MSERNQERLDLRQTYAFLEDGGKAPLIRITETFWKDLMGGDPKSPDAIRVARGDGWLVAVYPITADGAAWEMHPSGDEMLLMLSGEMSVVFQQKGTEAITDLPAGTACIVPRGVWHRQVVRRPGEFLGVTYGKGTQHRPR